MKVTAKNPWNDYKLYRELNKIFDKISIDLLLSFTIKPNIYGSMIAAKYNIPCIATVTGFGKEIIKENFFSSLLFKFYQYALRNNPFVIFHNQEDLLSFNNQSTPKNNHIVINGSGVNAHLFKPNESQGSGDFIFLFSGRLIKSKGIIEFLRAAENIKLEFTQVQFWIIGKHSEEELDVYDLLMEFQDKNIIKYFGFMEQPIEILNRIDALVLPSYREGKSKSILEAMSMQKPVVCSDVAGCHDLIRNEWNGYLVEAKNITSLQDGMVKMMRTDPNTRKLMGQRSRAEVLANYDIHIITNMYLELVQSEGKQRLLSSKEL